MTNLGVIEGFFGPQWPLIDRKSYASFLRKFGAGFYIYAPKQDPHLRKKWRDTWEEDYLAYLKDLCLTFQSQGISFGVGFSPFELGLEVRLQDKSLLEEKLEALSKIGIDILGLFFDDMPVSDNLAKAQISALEIVRAAFKGKIVFCPSYYTPDPILDKVFGQRPEGYLEELADGLPVDVSIAWTGPKVISPEIPLDHMQATRSLLKRKPFIWENLYANDGPRNCKYLKLRSFTGREPLSINEAEAYGFNMLNQPQLSKILFLSSKLVIDGLAPEEAFSEALKNLTSPAFCDFLIEYRQLFLEEGLDKIDQEKKEFLISELQRFPDLQAREIEAWLKGDYLVGSECLTD